MKKILFLLVIGGLVFSSFAFGDARLKSINRIISSDGDTGITISGDTLVFEAGGTNVMTVTTTAVNIINSKDLNVTGSTTITVDETISGDLTLGNSLDINMDDADDQVTISQTNVTGAHGQPLIFIDDDRTGTYADSTAEATLRIDAEGDYALHVEDGSSWFQNLAYFYSGLSSNNLIATNAISISNYLDMGDDVIFRMGSDDEFEIVYDTNSTGDSLLKVNLSVAATVDSSCFFISKDLDPSAMTDHDDYASPTIVMVNDEGADARDYAGVVIGERAQSDVTAVHYFDFYAMTGAVDAAVDGTAAEIAPAFRFGDNPTATGHSLTSGDVVFNDDIEVDGTTYLDGLVGVGSGISTVDEELHIEVNQNSQTTLKISNTDTRTSARAQLLFENNAGTSLFNFVCSTHGSVGNMFQFENQISNADVVFRTKDGGGTARDGMLLDGSSSDVIFNSELGELGVNNLTPVAQVDIVTRAAGTVGLQIAAAVSATANNLTINNSDGNPVFEIGPNGGVTHNSETVTCASEAGAAAVTLNISFLVSDGDADNDEDTVSLATTGAVGGDIHIFTYKTNTDGGDSVNVTPVTMAGGTKILFDTAGEGCTMVFDGTSWVVVANNGGVIS